MAPRVRPVVAALAALVALVLAAPPALARVRFGPAARLADAVAARMTVDEKLALVAGAGTGCLGGQAGTAAIPRLGVPALALGDGPNGVGNGATGVTAFPAPTSFRLGRPAVRARGAGRFDVRVPVTNPGRRTGTETVQLYVGFLRTAGEPPSQLKAFARVAPRPGRTRTATLRLGPSSLRVFDPRTDRSVVPRGRFTVRVGTSSRDLSKPLALREGVRRTRRPP